MNRAEIYGEYEEEVWLTMCPEISEKRRSGQTKQIMELMVELNKRTKKELIDSIENKLKEFKLLKCWSPECMGDDSACMLRSILRNHREESR